MLLLKGGNYENAAGGCSAAKNNPDY